MLTRIQPRAVIELARRDLPAPVDVINLISTADFNRYRWYGLGVMPALMVVGGRVLWMGRFERTISGEQQCEKLLIVRYPSHRRFLAMTLNPYYLAINKLREAGVSRFEASFTHASHSDPGLARRRELIGVHFTALEGGDGLAAVTEILASSGCESVYRTRVTASLGILEPPVDTDPHPLSYEELALFAPGESGPLEQELEQTAAAIAGVCARSSVSLYKREPRSTYRPSLRLPPQAEPAR